MKRCRVIAALSAACAGAAHAEWKAIASATDSAPAMAYDAKRVRYEPPYVTTWTRIVPTEREALSNGVEYQSVLQKVAIDCNERSWAVTYSEFYANRIATGAALYFYSVPRDEWDLRPAKAGSSGARLVGALCSTPKPW